MTKPGKGGGGWLKRTHLWASRRVAGRGRGGHGRGLAACTAACGGTGLWAAGVAPSQASAAQALEISGSGSQSDLTDLTRSGHHPCQLINDRSSWRQILREVDPGHIGSFCSGWRRRPCCCARISGAIRKPRALAHGRRRMEDLPGLLSSSGAGKANADRLM